MCAEHCHCCKCKEKGKDKVWLGYFSRDNGNYTSKPVEAKIERDHDDKIIIFQGNDFGVFDSENNGILLYDGLYFYMVSTNKEQVDVFCNLLCAFMLHYHDESEKSKEK